MALARAPRSLTSRRRLRSHLFSVNHGISLSLSVYFFLQMKLIVAHRLYVMIICCLGRSGQPAGNLIAHELMCSGLFVTFVQVQICTTSEVRAHETQTRAVLNKQCMNHRRLTFALSGWPRSASSRQLAFAAPKLPLACGSPESGRRYRRPGGCASKT